MTSLNINDPRLTASERRHLRTIAFRLKGGLPSPPRQYREAAERAFKPGCDPDPALEAE